jgi:hypothetical protein
MHWLGDVLELLRAGIGEGSSDAAPGMLAHRRRDADPAGLGERLQPCRNIDCVAEEIAVPHHHIAQMNPDAKQHAPVGRQSLVRLANSLLDRQCTGKPVGDTRELGQHRVPRRVGDAAAIFRDPRRSDLPAPGQ